MSRYTLNVTRGAGDNVAETSAIRGHKEQRRSLSRILGNAGKPACEPLDEAADANGVLPGRSV